MLLWCHCQELELRWQEYYELVTMLLQWMRHHIIVFEERKFPTSYDEIDVRFIRFRYIQFMTTVRCRLSNDLVWIDQELFNVTTSFKP